MLYQMRMYMVQEAAVARQFISQDNPRAEEFQQRCEELKAAG